MKSILSDNTTLEPIMRVAFSKSGTSQDTNSQASTEDVQKKSACANHTDIANKHEENKEHCQCIWKLNCEKQTVRKRICENGSVQRQQRDGDLHSLWPASSDMSRLAYCCCIADIACGIGLFHMARASSRLTPVHVNTSQNISGCEVLQRVYRPAGRSHMLKHTHMCSHPPSVTVDRYRL